MKLTKKGFARWLSRQSRNRRFRTECGNNCPIASYIVEDLGYGVADVCHERAQAWKNKDACYEDMCATCEAKWIGDFVETIDAEYPSPHRPSPKQCLEVLNRKPVENY